jgi:ABC-type lipoprotein release transport system permease subunit
MVTSGDGGIRINQVSILGVDDRFFTLSPAGKTPVGFGDGGVMVSSALATRLGTENSRDSEVVVRIDKPAALSRDLTLAPTTDHTVAMRLPVRGVADDAHFGRFSLEANQQEPLNLFVPLTWLQAQLERIGQANLLLIDSSSTGISAASLTQAIKKGWRLADAEAALHPVKDGQLELRSSRVFLDHALGRAALETHPDAQTILTYFVNGLRVGNIATPYSMVTAVGGNGGVAEILPSDMTDDEIVINQWLAEDLDAGVGDSLTLAYFLPGDGQSLTEARRSFKIRRIVPMAGAAIDAGLMPDFPGLSDAESCSEWDPGLPIDLDRIRGKDEAYWDNYRGTPKAFVTLAAGQAMWANRYGNLTAVRFPTGPANRDKLSDALCRRVNPASMGLFAIPVRDIGSEAAGGGTDFGQLFLGLSMFLIAASILLTCLLFVFAVEGRSRQTGMLLAIGFPARRIRRLYLAEGALVSLLGALVGSFLGLAYTRLLIFGLSTAWQEAVAGTAIRYSASFQSQTIGFLSGILISLLAMIWALRRQTKGSAHSLLSGDGSVAAFEPRAVKRKWGGWALSMVSLAGAIILLMKSRSLGANAMAGAFFGAGTLLLVSVITRIGMILGRLGTRPPGALPSLSSLALLNSSRRWGRSMSVVAMLACGVFMVVAVSANRKDPGAGAEMRSSGTGGFALYAESSVPVVQDLSSETGRRDWGLDADILNDTRFVGLRVRDGDDASCLNLNRAQAPRILGASVKALSKRGAFAFQQAAQTGESQPAWELLGQDLGDGVVPAVGDYPTVYWGLGLSVGDEVIYRNRRGEEVRLHIVGMITSSVLQGSLIIPDTAMEKYFPEVEGYGAWLIDTDADSRSRVAEHLTRRLANAGLSVETSVERLAAFGKLENTYLSIFLVLGGLGLVLGCVGLGLIVVRNLLERQGELAMLRAVGFNRGKLLKMVCLEHGFLLGAGLPAGLICALIAVAPTLRVASGQVPFGLLGILMLAIGASGVLWVVMAARIALRGEVLTALRNE